MSRWDNWNPWDKEQILERLEKNSITKGEHKLYQGKIDSGIKYPRIQIRGKKYLVHRLAAYAYGFDFNVRYDESKVLHKTSCPYKNCWSKDCLYLGNQSDNMRDAHSTGSRDNVRYKNQYTKD